MNAGTNLLLTLSLLFAMAVAGSAISEQRNEESDTTTPSRIAINHNETMLFSIPRCRDTDYSTTAL